MGGEDDDNYLASVELFPPSDACSIPDLPQPRSSHSLSLLSGARLVVCGGFGSGEAFDFAFDSCDSWVAGNTSWNNFHTMRCLSITFKSHNHLHQTQSQYGKSWSHGVDATFSSRLHCTARRRRCSRTHCRDGARY